MARLPRLIVPGLPHLLSQRAQQGQPMLRDDDDRRALLALLRDVAVQQQVAVHAYALHEDRFDLVATPGSADSLSRLMQAVARRHAAAFNRRHGRRGGLWEGRFRVAVLDPASWLLPCMVHVEQGASPWSSAAQHRGEPAGWPVVDPPAYWALGNTPFEREIAYRALAERGLTSNEVRRIEAALRGGWALGSGAFVEQLAQLGPRPAAPRRRGRPLKQAAAD